MERRSILEVHIISAQKLKPPPSNMRRTETYAVVWVDPATKLRTRVDRVGGENPTWNDKFFFRVSNEFLAGDTSAVTVDIFAVGYIRDYPVGSARLLLSNVLSTSDAGTKTPSFTALGIRRPSGKIHGVLNLGATLINGSDFAALKGGTAIGYRDLMGENLRPKREGRRRKKLSSEAVLTSCAESCDNSCCYSADFSDGCDSTTSSSSTASTVLKEWNGLRELAGKSARRASIGGGFLCGLLLQR
ncbi:uncharacterized protein LOC116202625 [Punica granatum]|uniref:Uncharacterized protein LOC116202625 n=2 Tax=Punica granatum TaxID=22663 RepID=A0A6P8CZ88_PUNGR|nr:uncharacterized protein LOC116202625 [Punica granatum]PKI38270.1 hypothetical protein CRG98_041317 [Punica granatum]